MSDEVAWRFDPLPPSGSITGGSADALVFEGRLATFVREVLQNSHDQHLGNESGPVEVDFAIHDLSRGSPERRALEDALDWASLRTHLEAVAHEGDNTVNVRIRHALEALEQGPLQILTVSDVNTSGLVGREDERRSNYMALCRNVLDTPAGRKPGRGGSYGLGKAVLWRCSRIGTVLFHSRLSEPLGGQDLRFVGRTVQPYHETSSQERWDGPGWLGAPDGNTAVHRSVSVLGSQAHELAESLLMDRQSGGPGTTISVLAFHEPDRDEQRPSRETAADILRHASKWFWPAMTATPATLTVTARVLRDGEETWSDIASTDDLVAPFVSARNAEAVQHSAPTAGDVAERLIDFEVPGVRDPGEGQSDQSVNASLRLRLSRTDKEGPPLGNTIALTRGAGMVVDYVSWANSPADGRPFFAVLEAGLAHGNSTEDEAAELFLRAAEPPAHDSWELTESVKARYRRGGGARLAELEAAVAKAIDELCGMSEPPSSRGPDLLAKLLPLGDKAGRVRPPGPKFTVDYEQASFMEGVWRVSGTVNRKRGKGPWEILVHLKLDSESGRPDAVPLEHVSAKTTAGALSVEESQESALVAVPESHNTVGFDIESAALGTAEVHRTRLLADVRPRLRTAHS